ncbi:MAG TPA: recombinase family protein [bacterium]|nr:recombinase family protein [bacterium]
MSKTIAYVTKNRVGRPDEKQRAALAAYMTAHEIKPEIIEDSYSKKKPWLKRKELSALVENVGAGTTLIFPALEHLGHNTQDRIALLSELMKRKVIVHLVAEGIVLKNFSDEGIALFGLFSALLVPEKKTPGRKPGRPAKKKRGRPAKRKPGRPPKKKRGRPAMKKKPVKPPKKKLGRPKLKKKPGRPPARKKRVSPIQQQFNDKIPAIRTYLKSHFSVMTISEMLELPYMPLLKLIKKHPTLSGLVKKGR